MEKREERAKIEQKERAKMSASFHGIKKRQGEDARVMDEDEGEEEDDKPKYD